MKAHLVRLVAVLGVSAVVAACGGQEEAQTSPPVAAESAQFKPGQVWRFKARDAEQAARVAIGRIEAVPKIGTVVHVKLLGLHVKNAGAPGGTSSTLAHVPITEEQLSASVLELTNEAADLGGFEGGYETWLASYRSGNAGAFTIPLAEVVAVVEETLR